MSLCEYILAFGLQPWCILLTICISDCLSLAHIGKIRMNSLSVLFRDGKSSSYFLRELFEFELMRILLILWSAAMVQWQYFIMYFFIQGTKFLSPSMKAVFGTCPCPHSLDHLDFRLLIVAHNVKIRMNSLSVLF